MKSRKRKTEIVLSYEVTLPSHLYPNLRRLFALAEYWVNFLLKANWSRDRIGELLTHRHSWKLLEGWFERPVHIPSRIWRCICKMAAQVLTSQGERLSFLSWLRENPWWACEPAGLVSQAYMIETDNDLSKAFVKNVLSFVKNQGRIPELEELDPPKFRGGVFDYGADDSVSNGQAKRLVFGSKIGFSCKLSLGHGHWRWFDTEQVLPRRVRELLDLGFVPQEPSLLRRRTKQGTEIYVLKMVFKRRAYWEKVSVAEVFGIDLCPGTGRLAVGVFSDGQNFSKPFFFKSKLVGKTVRLLNEIDRLKHKLAEAKRKREGRRVQHLHGELKRRENKFRRLRKALVEVLVNEVLLVLELKGVRIVAVERLSRFEPPNWSKHYRRIFSMWFFRKFLTRLEEKGKRFGVKLVAMNPAYTTSRCARCGREVIYTGLLGKCECGVVDRDVNAARNIALRGLKLSRREHRRNGPQLCGRAEVVEFLGARVGTGGQPEGQGSEGVWVPEPLPQTPHRPRGSEPWISTLTAWFALIQCATLAQMLKNRKLFVRKM